ncbi:MAG: acetyl-CoA carboxylase carboxyltransferase subunit beta [Lawsonibacter sp.]|nr:acetyl-CoA carboxylase carboxyltransferase subunit beta [Lawsonibacter sp.]
MNRIFSQRRDRLLTYQAMREGRITAGTRTPCPACGKESSGLDWSRSLQVCPHCGFHCPMGAYYRLSTILDPGSFQELEEKLAPADPLSFPDYPEKLAGLEQSTGLKDAAVGAVGKIEEHRAVFVVMDSRFLMGSMSTAVGEKVTRCVEYAGKKKLPLIIFSASGGARMQEGIFSLMQMAKTAAAIQRFQSRGGLYISCLTHPTTGGVTASFASLGDIMLAEPGALIGFAGPRVIEQTIGEKLPEGFQRAEYLLDHGFLDEIVTRDQWRAVLARLLALHERG